MSKSKIKLTITTPIKTVFTSEDVDQITLTTTSGEITVLPHHIPLISTLKTGYVLIKSGEEEKKFSIAGGILEVRKNSLITILSDRSENAREIDLQRAKEAIKKAEEYMKNPEEYGFNYKQLQAIMAKERNRIKLAEKGRRR